LWFRELGTRSVPFGWAIEPSGHFLRFVFVARNSFVPWAGRQCLMVHRTICGFQLIMHAYESRDNSVHSQTRRGPRGMVPWRRRRGSDDERHGSRARGSLQMTVAGQTGDAARWMAGRGCQSSSRQRLTMARSAVAGDAEICAVHGCGNHVASESGERL
jgi:hypothetical protein